jgi:hypothetical protein
MQLEIAHAQRIYGRRKMAPNANRGQARQGEILINDAAYTAAGQDLGDLERQQLELKGKQEPIEVRVLRISAA